MLTWTPPSSNAEQNAREILSAAMWIHSTFKDEVWLWRGQANRGYGVEPGMHTRVFNASKVHHTEEIVARATADLLDIARRARLDRQAKTRLPDLALLAHLQHYGAGTPLLDVSTDPLIALWMIAFENAKEPASRDNVSGMLFGIRRPPKERWISPLDARPYADPLVPSVSSSLGGNVWWYQAPDVTERLRIQRGSFLLGALSSLSDRKNVTIPLALGDTSSNWLKARMERRGKASNTAHSTSDIFAIVVRGSTKKHLRQLLRDRSGLSVEAVYPTPWHRPFISEFAEAYGRTRSLSLDLSALTVAILASTTKASSATHATKAAKSTKATKAAKTTKATKSTKAAKTTKSTKATKAGKATKATKATKAGKATKATKADKVAKAPKAAKATKATKAPKATKVTNASKSARAAQ